MACNGHPKELRVITHFTCGSSNTPVGFTEEIYKPPVYPREPGEACNPNSSLTLEIKMNVTKSVIISSEPRKNNSDSGISHTTSICAPGTPIYSNTIENPADPVFSESESRYPAAAAPSQPSEPTAVESGSDTMAPATTRFVFTAGSSAPTEEDEAPMKSVFPVVERALHGLAPTLPDYNEDDKGKVLEKVEYMLSKLDLESHTEIMKTIAANYVIRRQESSTMNTDVDTICADIFGPAVGVRFPADSFDDLFKSLDETLATLNDYSHRNHENWARAVLMLRGLITGNSSATDLVDAMNLGSQFSNGFTQISIPTAGAAHQAALTPATRIDPINVKNTRTGGAAARGNARPARVVADNVTVERGGGVELTPAELAALQADVVKPGEDGSGTGKKAGKKGKGGKAKKH